MPGVVDVIVSTQSRRQAASVSCQPAQQVCRAAAHVQQPIMQTPHAPRVSSEKKQRGYFKLPRPMTLSLLIYPCRSSRGILCGFCGIVPRLDGVVVTKTGNNYVVGSPMGLLLHMHSVPQDLETVNVSVLHETSRLCSVSIPT